MKPKDIEKTVARLTGSLFGGDRMMMRKNITVDNSFYRKGDPDRVLWHGKWSVELNVCVLAICVAAVAAGTVMAMKGVGSKIFRRKRCK